MKTRNSSIELSDNFKQQVNRRPMQSMNLAGAALLALSSVSLSGCGEKADKDAFTYRNIKECVTAGVFTEKTCIDMGNQSYRDHLANAPRFESKKDCDDSYDGQCQQVVSSSGHSSFMPYYMGYLMGRDSSHSYATPVYRSGGGYVTASGSSLGSAFTANSRTQGFKTTGSSITRPAAAGYVSHASVVSRGGAGSVGARMSVGS